MRFDRATRTRITLTDLNLDVDPTGTTIELWVDGAWRPATWQGTPIQAGDKWTQTARTTGWFAGPDADPNDATILTATRHHTKTRVITPAGDILADDWKPIDVDGTATTPAAPVIPPTVSIIGLDIDGTPYVDPAGVTTGATVGTDTDGTPYIETTGGVATSTIAVDTDGTPYFEGA